MSGSCKTVLKNTLVFLLLILGISSWQQSPVQAASASQVVSYVNYNCSDFGSRERAQSEFNQYTFDKYGLDRDGDGQVCEWNPSMGKWGFIAAGLGLLVGRYAGKRKKFGPDSVVPFPKGLLFDWVNKGDGNRAAEFDEFNLMMVGMGWWVPYYLMTILRDRVFSIGTPPVGLITTAFVLGFGLTYWAASTRDNWI